MSPPDASSVRKCADTSLTKAMNHCDSSNLSNVEEPRNSFIDRSEVTPMLDSSPEYIFSTEFTYFPFLIGVFYTA
jgi:hypothetical protein